jgi:hypothetical protein
LRDEEEKKKWERRSAPTNAVAAYFPFRLLSSVFAKFFDGHLAK